MTYSDAQLDRLDDALARLIHGDAPPVWRGFSPTREWGDLGAVLSAPCVLGRDLSVFWHEGLGIWEVLIDGGDLQQADRGGLPVAICCAVARAHHLTWETPA